MLFLYRFYMCNSHDFWNQYLSIVTWVAFKPFNLNSYEEKGSHFSPYSKHIKKKNTIHNLQQHFSVL